MDSAVLLSRMLGENKDFDLYNFKSEMYLTFCFI